MYIAINPAKCKRFTTKGINLSLAKPVGFVPPDLDLEFMSKVKDGLVAGDIFEIADDTMKSLKLKGQAEMEREEDTEVKTVGTHETKVSDPDERGWRKVESYTITFAPDPDRPIDETKTTGPSLIMTGIESDHDKA